MTGSSTVKPSLGPLARVPHGARRPAPPFSHVQYACHYLCTGGAGDSPQQAVLNGYPYLFDQWWHDDQVWVLDHDSWVPAGTLHVSSVGCLDQDAGFGLAWGQFSLVGDAFGYAGTWTWDYGHGADGLGIGSRHFAAGTRLLEIRFLMTPPGVRMPPVPDRPAGCPGTGDPELDAVGYLRLAS